MGKFAVAAAAATEDEDEDAVADADADEDASAELAFTRNASRVAIVSDLSSVATVASKARNTRGDTHTSTVQPACNGLEATG